MNTASLAAHFFLPEQEIAGIQSFGNGNVNDTFLVTLPGKRKLILQRVNPSVFPDPQLVQYNIRIVTDHLRQLAEEPALSSSQFIPLFLYKGKNGDTYQDESGAVWRMMNYIPGKIYQTINSTSQALELGRCLGIFHRLLSSLEKKHLADTLPGFHHTPFYLRQYDLVRGQYNLHPDEAMEFCSCFIEERRGLASLLIEAPGLRRSIIHGDPKVANFVFADKGDRVISIIDLDTIRPGLLLHDIGDGLRSCCNPHGEIPPDSESVCFDAGLFNAWLAGYWKEAQTLLTDDDKDHIVDAVCVIAFELGLRFFTDHLSGDRYFKVRSPGQNLFRAQVQFHVVQSIEQQREQLQMIVRRLSKI